MTSKELHSFIQRQRANEQGIIIITEEFKFSEDIRISYNLIPIVFNGKFVSDFKVSFEENCHVTFNNAKVKTLIYSPSNYLNLRNSKIESLTYLNIYSSLNLVGEVNIEECSIIDVDLNRFNHKVSIINSEIKTFRLQGNSNLDLEIKGKNGKKSKIENIKIFGNYSNHKDNNRNLKISNSIIGNNENREISDFNTEFINYNFSNVDFFTSCIFFRKKKYY